MHVRECVRVRPHRSHAKIQIQTENIQRLMMIYCFEASWWKAWKYPPCYRSSESIQYEFRVAIDTKDYRNAINDWNVPLAEVCSRMCSVGVNDWRPEQQALIIARTIIFGSFTWRLRSIHRLQILIYKQKENIQPHLSEWNSIRKSILPTNYYPSKSHVSIEYSRFTTPNTLA